MLRFSIPARCSEKTVTVDTFLGCDLTSHPAAVDIRMSPHAPNMIRDVPGKVRKCMGYETVRRYTDRINGAKQTAAGLLVHAGSRLWLEDRLLCSDMADARSSFFDWDGQVYILDGSHYRVFEPESGSVARVADRAKVPLLTIGKAPEGGGTAYEPLNLLTAAFSEQFLSDGTAKEYQLSFSGLDERPVQVSLREADGWRELTEGEDFSVDYEQGSVLFTQPLPESPVTGEDSLKITAYRTVEGYADRVEKAAAGILYGAQGAPDRLFLGGAVPGRDYWSDPGDPTCFSDLSYSVLCRDGGSVIGYSQVEDLLAAHLSGSDRAQVVLRRSGTLEGKTVFLRSGSLTGPAAVSGAAFAVLAGEPVFLTGQGVFALTPDDVTGSRYLQNRSWYLDGRLCGESAAALAESCAAVYRDICWFAVGGKGYLLDGLQPLPAASGQPYSCRQYVGFLRPDLPARVLWTGEGRLWFGTPDGRVCRFYADPGDLASYADDGRPITARWETPLFNGEQFDRRKKILSLSVLLCAAPKTGVRAQAAWRGIWRTLGAESAAVRYFDWSRLDWSAFSWSGDAGPRLLRLRVGIRRTEKVQFAVENSSLKEPFGLLALSFRWRQNSTDR